MVDLVREEFRQLGLPLPQGVPALEVIKAIGSSNVRRRLTLMGSTRMSSNPGEGVVDAHCQVHGVPGLFVAGSSIFPTTGAANPTLMIVATAVRLADHLKAQAAKDREPTVVASTPALATRT